MQAHLVNKTEFAAMAGVSVAAVTKATKRGKLQAAMSGTKVDANHPDALEYIQTRCDRADMAENGIDPLYDLCVQFCEDENKWSHSALSKNIPTLGRSRAKKIFSMIIAAGLVPAVERKTEPEPPRPTVPVYTEPEPEPYKQPYKQPPSPKPTARPSGRAALKAERKQAPTSDLPADLWKLIPEDIRELGHKSLRDLVDIFGTDTRFKDWLDSVKKIEDIHEKRIKNSANEGELVHVALVKKGIIDPIDAAHRLLLSDASITMARRLHTKFKGGMTVEEGERYIQAEMSKHFGPMKDKIKITLRDL